MYRKFHQICPRPDCKKEVESTVDATPGSLYTNDLMDISPSLFNDFPIFKDTSQKKREGESTNKSSSKKAKKQVSKEDSPILKKLIEELTSTIPEDSEKEKSTKTPIIFCIIIAKLRRLNLKVR